MKVLVLILSLSSSLFAHEIVKYRATDFCEISKDSAPGLGMVAGDYLVFNETQNQGLALYCQDEILVFTDIETDQEFQFDFAGKISCDDFVSYRCTLENFESKQRVIFNLNHRTGEVEKVIHPHEL